MPDLPHAHTAATTPRSEALQFEAHSIDFIPVSERGGSPKDLFFLWFGANAMAVTLVTGAIGATFGLGLWWCGVAIVIGAVIGTAFVAYHSAQGPQLGLPQMIQSRAQFGFYGANLPMLIVIAMYLGFYAGGAILGAQVLQRLFGLGTAVGVAAITLLSLLLVLFGYKMMHAVGRLLTPLYVIVFAVLTATLMGHWDTFPGSSTSTPAAFATTPFMTIVSMVAAYYISYGPYVADYSRYLPERTPPAETFWYTYAGVIASAVWIMILGAAVQTAFGKDQAISGAANIAGSVGGWFEWITLLTLGIGLANIGAFNIYGAMMSTLTVATTVAPRWRPGGAPRTAFSAIIALTGGLLAGAASDDFVHAYENFIFFIITFLIPWSAINLVDYYAVRKGRYEAADLFTSAGQYGSFNVAGLSAFAVGCVAQVPFIRQSFYTGPVAAWLGFDCAWIVGLCVPGAFYYVVARGRAIDVQS